MKHKLFLTTLSLGMTTAFLPLTLQAADDPTSSSSPASSSSSQSLGQGATGKSASSISGQSQKFVRLSQLTGSSVKNTSGESLGQINDLVLDPNTGRIEFAVISLKEGNSGKLTAIPWTLVRPSGEGQNLVANIDKDKLSSAQTFDRSQWPDMSQENWGQTVYSHYGLQWQDRSSAGGRVPLGGSDTGTGVNSTRPGIQGHDTDNSTAPDGKGTFQQDKPSKKFGTESDSSSTSSGQAKEKDSSSTSPQSKDKDSLK